METQPFSAPSKEVEPENPAPQILPPATVTIGGTSPVNVLHSTSPHQIVVQEKGSNTVANVFLIIGVVVFVMGLVFMGVGGKSFGDRLEMVDEIGAKKVSKMQPLFYDTIVFSSEGNTTNESFVFDTNIFTPAITMLSMINIDNNINVGLFFIAKSFLLN